MRGPYDSPTVEPGPGRSMAWLSISRPVVRAWLVLALSAGADGAAGQTSPAGPTEAAPAERSAVETPRSLRLWVTGGGGVSTGGPAALAGGTIALHDWSLGMRYAKTQSAGGSNREDYSEHLAVVAGRSLTAGRRVSISAGVVRSRRWKVLYEPCTGPDCIFDERRIGTETIARGAGLALIGEAHTRPLWGVASLGLEMTAFMVDGATTVGLNVVIDLGLL